MGYYWADDSACFIVGKSLNHWKLARYQAEATGTIGYLALHIPELNDVGGANSTANCTDDTVCWAIYDSVGTGTDPPNPGSLKAYGCVEGYNWDTIGINDYHTFNVTDTVTNLTVTNSNYYFIAVYSYALHSTLYANGGSG